MKATKKSRSKSRRYRRRALRRTKRYRKMRGGADVVFSPYPGGDDGSASKPPPAQSNKALA